MSLCLTSKWVPMCWDCSFKCEAFYWSFKIKTDPLISARFLRSSHESSFVSDRECSALFRSSVGIWTKALRATLKSVTTRPRIQSAKGILKFVFGDLWKLPKKADGGKIRLPKKVDGGKTSYKSSKHEKILFLFLAPFVFLSFFLSRKYFAADSTSSEAEDCWTFFHQKLFFISSFLLKPVHSLTPTLANGSLMFKIDSVTIWLVIKPVLVIRTWNEYLNFLNSFYCQFFKFVFWADQKAEQRPKKRTPSSFRVVQLQLWGFSATTHVFKICLHVSFFKFVQTYQGPAEIGSLDLLLFRRWIGRSKPRLSSNWLFWRKLSFSQIRKSSSSPSHWISDDDVIRDGMERLKPNPDPKEPRCSWTRDLKCCGVVPLFNM